MTIDIKIAYLFSSIFFLTGLLSGIWKYIGIAKNGKAHIYVDILHRAAFFYSFASVLIANLPLTVLRILVPMLKLVFVQVMLVKGGLLIITAVDKQINFI